MERTACRSDESEQRMSEPMNEWGGSADSAIELAWLRMEVGLLLKEMSKCVCLLREPERLPAEESPFRLEDHDRPRRRK